MRSAVVVDAVRTPIGRSHREHGWFREVRGDDLLTACFQALLQRNKLDPARVEDVLVGCTQQTLEQGLNVARTSALMAGVSASSAGATINRLCGSSLQALNQAVHAIQAGAEDVHLVGGVEHMHHLPMDHGLDINPKLYHRTSQGALLMGVTAEFLAQSRGISRRDQDEFAVRSHQKAAAAGQTGAFDAELVPIYGRDDQGRRFRVTRDQSVRPDTNLEALSALTPAFLPKVGTVTAGNSSPTNDGAAALLVMSQETAQALGYRPLVRVRATAVAGVEPSMMGMGPVPATLKVLRRANLPLEEIDLIELNEAFAAQALACIRELKLDEQKVNVRGGALALGHPLGASGARIATTLIHAMRDRDVQFGLATMCIGLGQGVATIFEQVS